MNPMVGVYIPIIRIPVIFQVGWVDHPQYKELSLDLGTYGESVHSRTWTQHHWGVPFAARYLRLVCGCRGTLMEEIKVEHVSLQDMGFVDMYWLGYAGTLVQSGYRIHWCFWRRIYWSSWFTVNQCLGRAQWIYHSQVGLAAEFLPREILYVWLARHIAQPNIPDSSSHTIYQVIQFATFFPPAGGLLTFQRVT